MKGTLFSADFVKDSNGNLRLLELNTDTGFIDQELVNFNFDEFLTVLSSNNLTTLDIIYKPYLHIDFVNKLIEEVNTNLPSVTTVNLHDENINSIYPSSVMDNGDNFILRIAYDESAIFDSTYCKNRLNVYNLFTENSITDNCVAYYHSSSLGTFNTLTKEINDNNIPDVTIKDINESFNPIDFFKLSGSGTAEEKWDNFIVANSSDDKLIEQYHFHSSTPDSDGHMTSIRFFGLVYGPNLDVISLHTYKISAIFELPSTIDFDPDTNKVQDQHYYEYTTNFVKSDSGGILSKHEVLMDDDSWSEISQVQVGETIKSYYVSGSPQSESDLNSLTWNYDGGQFPIGSYITTSDVIFKDVQTMKYGAMMEMVVDSDSLFSGINKKYLVFDSLTNKSSFKFISEINAVTDSLYDLDGNLIQVDELNFYVSTDKNLTFVEIDVEETDTYIINGSTAFHSLVSHNSPCFVAGTKIMMEDGTTKNIEDVIVGDTVISFDFKNQEKKSGKVKNIFSKKVSKVVIYEFDNGGTLKATVDHPLFVEGKGWSSYDNELSNNLYNIGEEVHKIDTGDVVKLFEGSVTLADMRIVEDEIKVFNLSDIETNHNYFANDVLVHNRACFVEGTLIEMGDGTRKPIENIVVGDIVVSLNTLTKTKENQLVTNLIKPIHNDLVKYSLENGVEIICTFDHPFFVNGFNLSSYSPLLTNERYSFDVKVQKIELGDNVNLIDGSTSRIVEIQEQEIKPTQTYIFEVENNHNFYANGILTHNKACFVPGTKVLMGNGSEKSIEEISVGDVVISYNEDLNLLEEKQVIDTISPIHDDLVSYNFSDGTEITSTYDHPYYVEGFKLASYRPTWTKERYKLSEVREIKLGDKFYKPNGSIVELLSIKELERINIRTHIITIDGNHNFYANGILVHNK